MRLRSIDCLRGIAVIFMIIYHILFDLTFLGIFNIDLSLLPIRLIQLFAGGLFVFICGLSARISYSESKKPFKRTLKLTLVALLITLVTFIYPHFGYIKFGIIHFMALSGLLLPLFARFDDKLNYLFGLTLIFLSFFLPLTDSEYLFWLGLVRPDYYALDHYPLIPWFGLALIGQSSLKYFSNNFTNSFFEKLGRNSLVIYLIHQPIILLIFYLLGLFTF